MADRGIGIRFELKDSRSMFFHGFLDYSLPMKKSWAAATQYRKQKLPCSFATFKVEQFSGLSIVGVSIYELPVSLLQETVLISNSVNVPTTHPEPPVVKAFNCVIEASTCCKYSTSVSWEGTGYTIKLKKASTISLSKDFSSFTAMFRSSLTFGVTLNEKFTNETTLSFGEIM